MKPTRRNEEISESLRRLTVAYTSVIRHLEETLAVLCRERDLADNIRMELKSHWRRPAEPVEDSQPVADRATFSVQWQGRSCFLGSTLRFGLFEALSLRPNKYWSHDELLVKVWRGPRSNESIRNVVKRLRDKLCHAGMEDVAKSIDGSVRGH